MTEPYWWYILYVRAGSENRVIADLRSFTAKRALRASFDFFYPEAEQYCRGKKEPTLDRRYLRRSLFPGYVFIETDMREEAFLSEFFFFFYRSGDIIRILKDSSGGIALPDGERRRFEYLFRGKRCLEHSVGYIVGEQIVVEAGPLVGREGIVKKINRHNRDALIEMDLFGEKISVKVALEIISKQDKDAQ